MLETFTLLHALMIVLATILEVGANLFLKLSDGFRRKGYGILSIAMILAAFSCLFVALEGIELSVAYAVWGASASSPPRWRAGRCSASASACKAGWAWPC